MLHKKVITTLMSKFKINILAIHSQILEVGTFFEEKLKENYPYHRILPLSRALNSIFLIGGFSGD